MGSPISLSGFNNIDFNLILNAIMDQERIPVTFLENDLRNLEGQDAEYSLLATKLATVGTATEKLSTTDGFAARTLTNSDPTILTAGSSDTAPVGAYDVVVSTLARAQVTASTSTHPDSDTTVIANNGTLTIGGVVVTVSGDITLQGLAGLINGTPDIPATASVISTAPDTYQLVLTGNDTGAANGYAIANNLKLSPGQGQGGPPADITFGANAVEASDASLTVNDIAITSADNTIEGAIPGTTLTLLKSDPATTVTLSVARDNQEIKTLVDNFLTAYNDLTDYLDAQFTASGEGSDTAIGRDGLVRGLRNSMRQTLSQAYSVGGAFSYLAEVGIGADAAGDLTLNATLFDAALQDSRTDLESLFAGGGGAAGAFGTIETLIETYTDAGGLLPNVQDRLDTQMRGLSNRIFDLEERLEVRRASLQAEFIAADLAITKLNSQLDSLGALGNEFRLF